MKKLILIAACLGLMALGSGKAEAYTQSLLPEWQAGETASLHFDLPDSAYANVFSVWLGISAINPLGNDRVNVEGVYVGTLEASSSGVLHTTNFDIHDYFYLQNGPTLDVTILAGGPLMLGTSILTIEHTYASTIDNPPNGSNAPVPEPATLLLLGSGLSGLAFWGKRRGVSV